MMEKEFDHVDFLQIDSPCLDRGAVSCRAAGGARPVGRLVRPINVVRILTAANGRLVYAVAITLEKGITDYDKYLKH